MERSLIDLLLQSATVTDSVATRVHWINAPQGVERPNIVLNRITGIRDNAMAGPTGLVESRVQMDCYGLTYAAAKSAAQALETALSGYSGTHAGTIFGGCFLDNERDGYDAAASPDKLFSVSLDFIIWHRSA